MEIGGVSRTSSAASSPLAARQDLPSQAGAVRTDLAATKSVQQVSSVPENPVNLQLRGDAKFAAERNVAVQSFIKNSSEYDVKARELVTRSVNTQTGEVIRQFPDDIILKIRAFARDIDDRKNSVSAHDSDVEHVTRVV